MDEALIIGFYAFNYVELGSAEPALWFWLFCLFFRLVVGVGTHLNRFGFWDENMSCLVYSTYLVCWEMRL